jgi:carboxyl-terminal processing protease
MTTTARALSVLLNLLLVTSLILGVSPAIVGAQSQPRPGPGTAPVGQPAEDESVLESPALGTEARAAAVRRGLTALQEGWNLLLDRYVDPLEPAALAEASDEAMREALREKGADVSQAPLATEGDRAIAWAALQQRYQTLSNEYAELGPVMLAYAGLAAMAAAADDTHTHFLTPRQYRDHLAWTRGEVKYAGIGARLRGPILTIVEVFDGSPAAGAGLRAGDRILQVEDTSTEGLRVDEAVNLIRGPEGSAVSLTVQRAASAQVVPLTLQRAEIQVPFVESRRQDEWGYVRLRGFPEPTVSDQVERAVIALQEQGVRGIIMDLRGNSGGRLDVGSRLLSRFVPSGPIYQEVDRRGRQATRNVRAAAPVLTVPLAVLIDEGTASMGEIFAINVQEHRVGRLFGQTTMGSVAASQVLPLSDGSAVQLSVMQLFSGAGQRLNREGVHPDEEIELRLEDLQSGRDPQLERAVAYLSDQARQPATAAPVTAR